MPWPVRRVATALALCLAAAQAGAQPPASTEPAAAHIALARDLVIASGVGNSFQNIIPQMLDQIGQAITRSRPELTSDVKVVLAGVKADFDKKVDEMVDTAAKLYAQRLTRKELEDAVAFFKGASGRKYVGTQPALMTDMFVALQAWSQKISGEMMDRVREEMRKKGHQL